MYKVKTEELTFLDAIKELEYIRDYFVSADEKAKGKEQSKTIFNSHKLVYMQRIDAPAFFGDNEFAFTIGSSNINPFEKVDTTKSFKLAIDDLNAKWKLIINIKHKNYEMLKNELK